MKEELLINGIRLEYDLRTSKRARNLQLALRPGTGLVVTLPRRVPKRLGKEIAERFIREKSLWILRTLERFKSFPPAMTRIVTPEEISGYKEQACTLAMARLAYFNSFYVFTYAKVSIKNQKTRWGSCSRKGNLNFNYKIALLPPQLTDYIIVHELCHLKEMNHSPAFWKLVAKTIPDHVALRKMLRNGNIGPG